MTLVYKKVGILSEMNRHPEALAFMRDRMRRRSTPELQRLYSTLVLDAARAERQRDPYVLYGTAFERGDHSREVVDYLLNTSMLRGYNDDALFYLREMRRYYGDDKPLLYKEYLIYRNMGEERQAFNRLTLLCERYPGDGELTDALCRMQLQRADRLMEQELYTEALPAAMFVTRQRTDVETLRAAWEKVLSCRIRMKRYDDAMATLDTLATRFPDTENLVGKRAYVLDRMGRTSEAMYLYLGAIGRADPQMRDFYVAGYADIAIPYIRQCLDEAPRPMPSRRPTSCWRWTPRTTWLCATPSTPPRRWAATTCSANIPTGGWNAIPASRSIWPRKPRRSTPRGGTRLRSS